MRNDRKICKHNGIETKEEILCVKMQEIVLVFWAFLSIYVIVA